MKLTTKQKNAYVYYLLAALSLLTGLGICYLLKPTGDLDSHLKGCTMGFWVLVGVAGLEYFRLRGNKELYIEDINKTE